MSGSNVWKMRPPILRAQLRRCFVDSLFCFNLYCSSLREPQDFAAHPQHVNDAPTRLPHGGAPELALLVEIRVHLRVNLGKDDMEWNHAGGWPQGRAKVEVEALTKNR